MIFTVTWLPSAQNELTNAWLANANRKAITLAANEIDRELRIDPDRKGILFFGDRMLRINPLLVIFTVMRDDCLVEINQVMVMNP